MAHRAALVSLLILLPVIIGMASGTSVPRIFDLKDGEPCPATYFVLDCNNCQCPDLVHPACTKRGCDIANIPAYMDGMLCPAGKKFLSDCNECDCHEDGKSATCATKSCS